MPSSALSIYRHMPVVWQKCTVHFCRNVLCIYQDGYCCPRMRSGHGAFYQDRTGVSGICVYAPNDNNLASTQLFRIERGVQMAWQRPHHRKLRAEVRLWAQGGRAGAVHGERGARSAAAAAGGGALAQSAGREGPCAAQGCLRHPAAGADPAPTIRLQITDFHLVDVNRYLGMRRPNCNPSASICSHWCK